MSMSVALLFLPTLCLVAVAMPVPTAAAAAAAAVAVSMPAATAMIIMVHGAIAGSRLVWLQRRLLLHCLFLPSTAMTVPMAPTSMTVSVAACSAHRDTSTSITKPDASRLGARRSTLTLVQHLH